MKDGIFNIRPGYMKSQKCLEYMGFLVTNMIEVAEIVKDEVTFESISAVIYMSPGWKIVQNALMLYINWLWIQVVFQLTSKFRKCYSEQSFTCHVIFASLFSYLSHVFTANH